MSRSGGFTSKFVWTAGTFGLSAGLRFGLNVALSWLLAPEIMGIMVIVNAVRLGVDLLTDVGIEQNIVHHPDGLDPHFRDTAWTMQVTRGLMLSCVFVLAAPWLADLYQIDVRIFLVAALSPVLAGLHSTAIYVLVKRLEVPLRSSFELATEFLAVAVTVALALWLRSVWAPVFGLVAAVAMRSALSYALPEARQRLRIDRAVALRILHFGKWIAITTLVTYAATYLDRLYLGRVAPLALVGIYGIARAVAEVPTSMARRMSYQVVFPALAGATDADRGDRLKALGTSRLWFTLALCMGLAATSALGDVIVRLIYDHRYEGAGWMLSILLMGGVMAVLSNLNEALLLSAGRPHYSTIANVTRLATLAVLMPSGFAFAGVPGAIVAVAATELLQYGYIGVGLTRVRMAFWRQDAAVLAASAGLFAAILAVRAAAGWGSPLAAMGEALR
ncbi:oligosaccharide flippase family protein [Sphingomonas sp. Y38-1Y]|uniref:oligosaccharide flippase family protein n=1 Tax=Sphingomonas sp. Y38-1Y TaxID=3078265 RepID=UPI0028EB60EF|nr:oligosaccharide flippase family protein [Sphingomonas sp. Y38-1Y]